MLGLLYKRSVGGETGSREPTTLALMGRGQASPSRSGTRQAFHLSCRREPKCVAAHNSISRKAVGRPMKELLLELAEAVQHAVTELVEDPAEVVGRGADGAPSARIDRVAETAVLRVLDYEDARLNVLSEEAGFIDRRGDRTIVLDPIDGTHNALRGVPAYSLSMAIGPARPSDVEEGLLPGPLSRATDYAAQRHR